MTANTTSELIPFPLKSISGAGTTIGPVMDVRRYEEMLYGLQVTAIAGTTPTLNVFIDVSTDGQNNWHQLQQLGPANIATAPANNPYPSTYLLTTAVHQNTAFGDFIRIRAVLAGTTPSATLGVYAVGKGS